jgi:hypothetical protein
MTTARGRCIAVAVATCGVLAGCSGHGHAAPGSASSARTSASAPSKSITLTDRRTIDPCSLVPQEALTRFGRVLRGQSPEGLLACEIDIMMADHGEAGVRIRIDATPTSATDIQVHDLVVDAKPGGLRIVHSRYENTREAEQCVHELDFADGSAIGVVAFAPSNLANDDFCMIGKAALAAVLNTVTSGHMQHRTWPPGTLASRPDLCGMVTRDALALVPGMGLADHQESPGGVECTWKVSDVISLSWSVIAAPIDAEPASGGPPRPYEDRVKIAGRPTTIINLYFRRCSAMTPGKPLGVKGLDGAPYREVALVYVSAPLATKQLCEITRKVAAKIWPQLPK